jgi:hypothetical protein
MVKCQYPDCDGELEPGAPFCEECGRSQAPAQVASATAGAQVRLQIQANTLAAPALTARPQAPPRPPRPLPAPPRREPTVPVPLALGFGLLLLVLFLGCMGALAIAIVTSPLIPLPATPTPQTVPGGGLAFPLQVAAPAAQDAAGLTVTGTARGSRTVTVVPAPGALSSPIVPPWALTISRTMASPSPLLPVARAGAPPTASLPW